jgi:imidazolonepropionase-like amidohydrolase/ABC-type polysaccharide/polyol phosphate export permease
MKACWALIKINLKLALRERTVLFFNYVFPLIFFFGFGQLMQAGSGGAPRLVAMVLIFGILGSGLFGAGMRAVAEREANILRRYKVAPISPAPILVASIVTGWVLFMPSLLLILLLARAFYGMPFPERFFALFCTVSAGIAAMRSVGLIIASVANSVAESNVLIQIFYMPMIFLSGATFPITQLPAWAQLVSQFLPATYISTAMQAVLIEHASLARNAAALGALAVVIALSLFISIKLFRWEKDQKIPTSAKLWLLTVLTPFVVLGIHQGYTQDNLRQARIQERLLRRAQAHLISNVRVFRAADAVLESAAVLIRNGRIERIWESSWPSAESLSAEAVDGAGKTLLPALVDVHVRLSSSGGAAFSKAEAAQNPDRYLAQYLYCGVGTVLSADPELHPLLAARHRIRSGETLGAEIFLAPLLFPEDQTKGSVSPVSLSRPILPLPQTTEEVRQRVREGKRMGVDAVRLNFDTAAASSSAGRELLRAAAEEARASGLPLWAQASTAEDFREAIAAGASLIEQGAAQESIPQQIFIEMASRGVRYAPMLGRLEAFEAIRLRSATLLDRSLAAQVAGPGLIAATRKALLNGTLSPPDNWGSFQVAQGHLLQAWRAGVGLVAGTASGSPLLIHGPALHRELQLWVAAGLSPAVALQAATENAARLLGLSNLRGIRPQAEASLLLVDGNPLTDISATERISAVFFKAERVDRSQLLR